MVMFSDKLLNDTEYQKLLVESRNGPNKNRTLLIGGFVTVLLFIIAIAVGLGVGLSHK